MYRSLSFLLAALVSAPAFAGGFNLSGIPDCPGNQPLRVVRTQPGALLESSAAEPPGNGHNGRLYLSDVLSGRFLVTDAPSAEPQVLLSGTATPGGLVWLADEGKLLAGVGNGLTPSPQTGVIKIDPAAPANPTAVAIGLNGSNGVARGPDGSIYTTSEGAGTVDRIAPDGTITKGWAKLSVPDGLSVDSTGRYLYVNQWLPTAAVQRIEIANPGNITPFYQPPLQNALALADGSTIDAQGRLYVTAFAGSAVARISPDRSACLLASDDPRLLGASQATIGAGGNFPRNNLYVTTYFGLLIELPNAVR